MCRRAWANTSLGQNALCRVCNQIMTYFKDTQNLHPRERTSQFAHTSYVVARQDIRKFRNTLSKSDHCRPTISSNKTYAVRCQTWWFCVSWGVCRPPSFVLIPRFYTWSTGTLINANIDTSAWLYPIFLGLLSLHWISWLLRYSYYFLAITDTQLSTKVLKIISFIFTPLIQVI